MARTSQQVTAKAPKPKRTERAAKVESIADVTTNFLFCRRGMTGHQWDWSGDYELLENSRGRLIECTRVFLCIRCEAVKTQRFRLPSMEPASNARIEYPDGYLIHGGRVKPIEVRVEHWERSR